MARLRWAAPGFVGGLTILARRPKLGKRRLALDVVLAVGAGGKAFGSVECVNVDVPVNMPEPPARVERSSLQRAARLQFSLRAAFLRVTMRHQEEGAP
jgi:hypothetical protein